MKEGFVFKEEVSIMEANCSNCGITYQQVPKTKIFCSGKCRKKSHMKRKKVAAASVPTCEVLSVEQAWVPTRRESILNKALEDADFNIFHIMTIAEELEDSPLAKEIIAIAKKANQLMCLNEVHVEVRAFDKVQRLRDPAGYEARTGLPV